MVMSAAEIHEHIIKAMPEAEVRIEPLADDGDHYAAYVRAREFAGKSRVQQHQMVYEALDGNVGGRLHALALYTEAIED